MTNTQRPANQTSHTEMSKLSHCEMAWHLSYNEGIKGEDKTYFQLGRLIDRGCTEINYRRSWQQWLAQLLMGEDAEWAQTPDGSHVVDTATWLLERYEAFYTPTMDHTVLHDQLDITAPIPGTDYEHRAIIDEVWQDTSGNLWMVERKTYGRRDRLDLVHVDPQLTLNYWAMRANGYDVMGIVFDGIYTYRWKTGKHLLSESFDRLFLDRHMEHVEAALDTVRATLARRDALRSGAVPLRNIGPLCRNCQQRTECFERLAFPQQYILDDDADEIDG